MTTPRIPLTDQLLTEALTRRAVGAHTAGDLVRDVRGAIESVPQGGWWSRTPFRRRLVPALLLVALLPALAGVLSVVGRTDTAQPTEVGEIAYVQTTYVCDPPPCLAVGTSDLINGLRAINPRVVTLSDPSSTPTPALDVPGTDESVTGWSIFDPRNSRLAGPAIAWSPDGEAFAFRLFNDAPGIYVHREGRLTRLVELADDANSGMAYTPGLAWSSDATRIAYTYPFGGLRGRLHVVDVADGDVVELESAATRVVAWSPDGATIAFTRSHRDNRTELILARADGTGELEIEAATEDGYHISGIDWAPDGSVIAFDRGTDSRTPGPSLSGVWVIAPDGTGLRRVTPQPPPVAANGGCCVHLAMGAPLRWSPDGTRIAHIEGVDGDGSVVVVSNVDGSGERAVASGYTFDWSPDGSQLLVADGAAGFMGVPDKGVIETDEWTTIGIVDADGTDLRWIGPGEFPAWSP
jgi:dipeptidyl aminopeptidase/acylaminoacyl peptidase